jgi:hypothetical protein
LWTKAWRFSGASFSAMAAGFGAAAKVVCSGQHRENVNRER